MSNRFATAPASQDAPCRNATCNAWLIRLVAGLSLLSLALVVGACASALHNAAARGDVQAARTLLDQGAQVNETHGGVTALVHASLRGHTAMMELLLDRGADVNDAHMMALTLERIAGAKFAYVHFRGAAEGIPALLGGHVEAGSFGFPEAAPHHRSGAFRMLGSTEKGPNRFLPSVKTLVEQGYPVDMSVSYGLVVPAGTPRVRPLIEQKGAPV